MGQDFSGFGSRFPPLWTDVRDTRTWTAVVVCHMDDVLLLEFVLEFYGPPPWARPHVHGPALPPVDERWPALVPLFMRSFPKPPEGAEAQITRGALPAHPFSQITPDRSKQNKLCCSVCQWYVRVPVGFRLCFAQLHPPFGVPCMSLYRAGVAIASVFA